MKTWNSFLFSGSQVHLFISVAPDPRFFGRRIAGPRGVGCLPIFWPIYPKTWHENFSKIGPHVCRGAPFWLPSVGTLTIVLWYTIVKDLRFILLSINLTISILLCHEELISHQLASACKADNMKIYHKSLRLTEPMYRIWMLDQCDIWTKTIENK